ncbi:2OG-Fe(II)oxygenase superfamily protein [Colletotrichum salicis]|uniref:2OG-Fe(II)oxygenase superfamily protein n=1 Tax=Colletotrichum salicis TaxID=1209931 RepID=A0A135U329_9PEZI|nr:2OG-Fe(II)oxygenase superfamily protein [Colletotrichum salicis]
MPSAISPEPVSLPKWQRPAKTQQELPWADIAVIDISKFDQPGGKKYLIDTGFTSEEVQRQYDIGQGFFNLHAEDEARPGNTCDFSKGSYFGYRSAHDKKMQGTDVLNNVESVNIAKFIPNYKDEPFHSFFERFRQEIEDFSRVRIPIFTSLGFALPRPRKQSLHPLLHHSGATRRLLLLPPRLRLPKRRPPPLHGLPPRPFADDLKVGNTWSRAHTDLGSLTLLWNQDVAGLQIKASSGACAGQWRYVPSVDNGIVCNVNGTLDFWSAGYLKSTTHRVVRPPEDQAHLFRQGLFYFVRPGDDVDIKPAPSPLLKRLGLVGEDAEEAAPVRGLQGRSFRLGNLEIEDEAE